MRAVLRSPVVGVVLLTLLASWYLLSTPAAPEATSGAMAHLLVAAGLVTAVLLARFDPAAPGLLVLTVAVVAYVAGGPASLSGEPLAPPLGYMNANGALLLCGAAGVVVAAARHPPALRMVASAIALLVAAVCWSNGAQAATAAAVLLAGWGLVRNLGPCGPWMAVGAALVGLPGLLVLAWGSGWLERPDHLVALLSDERYDLWHEAHRLMIEHPVTGVGPGRFSATSATAADPDLAWAHSFWLQAGAEVGFVGLAGVVLFLAWGIFALGRDAVLLGLLLLPATVDYVLHFAGVLVVLSLAIGASMRPSPAQVG